MSKKSARKPMNSAVRAALIRALAALILDEEREAGRLDALRRDG